MNKDAGQYVFFREVQKPSQSWIWLLVLVPAVIVWYFALAHLVESLSSGQTPNIVLLASLLGAGIVLPLLWFYTSLTIEVRTRDLYVRFIPFMVRRKIPYEEIEGHEARTFSAIKEYGGWGVRIVPKGRAYIMGENQGVELQLRGGKILMLGTRQPEEFATALDAARRSATP